MDTNTQPTIERIPSYKRQTPPMNAQTSPPANKPKPFNIQTPPAHPLSGYAWFRPELDRKACEVKLNKNKKVRTSRCRIFSVANIFFSMHVDTKKAHKGLSLFPE